MKIMVLIMVNLMTAIYDAKALGVVSDYLANDTMELVEGGSRLYEARIQNPGEEPLRVKLTYDPKFLKIIGFQDEYTIPPKSSMPVKFNITAENAEPGTYVVEYTVHQLSGAGAGLPLLLKVGKNFRLKIKENENAQLENGSARYGPLFGIAMVILLLIFISRKNKKSKR